jgi:cell division protease FtsH
LFELYLGKVAHDGTADTAALARMTAGMSPAEIANTVNKAASSAAEAHSDHGWRRASAARHRDPPARRRGVGGEGPAERRDAHRLAYHESGHALVGHWLKAGLVERVTIEPRGQALGVTYITRETEDPLYKQAELTAAWP